MMRGIVKWALLAALCSLPGIAGAEAEKDTDKEAADVSTDARPDPRERERRD